VPLNTTEYREWQLEEMFFAVATNTYSGSGFGSAFAAPVNKDQNRNAVNKKYIATMSILAERKRG
jgi:expansin (peptidoglycan-binding protein)